MVPREVDNIVGPPGTTDGSNRTTPKVKGEETTLTTSEPMQMRSTTDHNKSIVHGPWSGL